jgi:hypothetical protein
LILPTKEQGFISHTDSSYTLEQQATHRSPSIGNIF